ncbi:CheR family methyltransferase [Methanolacinia petrolearia]|uniref:CheR family methyltransferase n=1 Tax=Methanolacinia petrolearia TaxID=54120 RepID=UPI003BAC9C2C
MEDNDFLLLKRSIERLLAIQCGSYKEDYIKRRVLSRMRIRGKENYKDYNTVLVAEKDEQEAIRNALTINVTKFWRDKEVFDLIKSDIIPDIIRRKGKARIWSAGCSTGEEPYTLALIAYDLTRLKPDSQVTIYATDIDREVLKKAKEGIYDSKSLENLSEGQIRRHFTQIEDGIFQVKQHLKDMVRFSWHDLTSGKPAANYLDIVTCRNVTIYFTEQQKNDLAKMFHPALVMEGYYIMGKTEFRVRELESLYKPYYALQKIYKKA